MKLSPRSLLAALSLLSLSAQAIERLPIEDFTRDPDTTLVQLSPDGRAFGFLRNYNALPTLHIADLEAVRINRFELTEATLVLPGQKRVIDYKWVSDNRLVLTTAVGDAIFGLVAVNRDTTKPRGLSGYEKSRQNMHGDPIPREIVHAFGDRNHSVLMLSRPRNPDHPDVLRVNTLTGIGRTVVKNPGTVTHWGFDFEGVTRFGLMIKGELSGAIYRTGEKEPWKTILPLENRRGQLRIAGFDAANNRILVSMLNPQKRWAVYPLDPISGTFGDPLLSDPDYDIVPDRGISGPAGISLAGVMFSRHKQTLAGIRYHTEAPHVRWFDHDYAICQEAVDKVMPDTVNLLVDESQNGYKQLWCVFSDRHPGAYHLLDVRNGQLMPLAPRMGWIKPEQMAPMQSVKYAARDGLTVHGYLTIPPGHEPGRLPLVVMPHGGPWARDVWGFNPLVQLLANRGYAVLQMNYRGSTGYGDELFQQPRREIGGKIQDDIEHATRWAIATGVADPARIAIMGISYGGYSSLFALGNSPGLYRCGISIAGVTDWPAIYEDSDVAENRMARQHWREQIGDPDKDLARLTSISPVNFADKIIAPVLIIHGKADQRVPQDQATRMTAALEKVGRPAESLLIPSLGHGVGTPMQRQRIYQAVVGFLEKHLGPGVP